MSKADMGIRPVAEGRSRKVAMALYGFSGVGKTRLIGSGPKTLILRPPTDHTDSIHGGDAEEKVISDWNGMWEMRDYLAHEKGGGYQWVWLDSISLFQDHGLDDIWDNVVAEKPHRKKHGIDKGEYGVNMHRLGQWVRDMVGNPHFNFGVTAHPADLVGEDDEQRLMPYVQGKNMPSKVCGYMNLVAYLEAVKGGRRVLRTAPTDEYYAKDQFDLFSNGRLVDPTMPKLIAALDKTRPAAKAGAKPGRRRPTTRKVGQ